MKYIAIFDDEFLKNFRLDDGGLTLVMHDEAMATRAVRLFPIQHNTVTSVDGQSVYLSQGHIDAMLEYERNEMLKNMMGMFADSFDQEWKKKYFTETLKHIQYQNWKPDGVVRIKGERLYGNKTDSEVIDEWLSEVKNEKENGEKEC